MARDLTGREEVAAARVLTESEEVEVTDWEEVGVVRMVVAVVDENDMSCRKRVVEENNSAFLCF